MYRKMNDKERWTLPLDTHGRGVPGSDGPLGMNEAREALYLTTGSAQKVGSLTCVSRAWSWRSLW
jgi:hypothetical protein